MPKKLFEFTEIEVDEEVELALLDCKISYSWFEENARELRGKLNDIGLGQYRVTSLSDRKFLIRKDNEDNWNAFFFF